MNQDNSTQGGTARNEAGNPFLALVNQDHVAVAQTAADGRFVRVNRRWTEILGDTENEVFQLTFRDVTHPDSLTANVESIARPFAGASHFVLEKKYVRKNGSAFLASTTVSGIRDESGVITGMVALIVDLSSQQRSRRLVKARTMHCSS